jgi:hypothetical protein
MFDTPNNRKIQCFACGIMFDWGQHNEFKQHIIDKHNEGREYLLCPLCKFPVRDIKAHWVKHQGIPLPKNMPMRAIVWKDFSGKKKKTKKPPYMEGGHVSPKNGNKIMHYRSSWELSIYRLLDEWTQVTSYDVEPIAIPYYFNSSWKKYFPDLLVKFIDEHVEIWEIKPAEQSALPMNQAKWKFCEDYCNTLGFKFVVMTQNEIHKLKQKIFLERKNNL